MRNPLLQSLNRQPESTNIAQVIADIKSGKLDPKAKVLQLLQENPNLRNSIQESMPKISALARQLGVSDADISAFKAEANIR